MASDQTIVFYHTAPISDSPDKGSTLRVRMLSQAIAASGADLRVIAGNRAQRRELFRALRDEVKRGLSISYVYAENTNAPVSLEGRRLNPIALKQHVDFLRWVKANEIPLGYFYRDVHWRFPFFSNFLPGPVSRFLKPLYYLDWYIIDRYSDILFLPSIQMNDWLPRARAAGTYAALPPGFDPRQCEAVTSDSPGLPRRLLYVGGLQDPVYSLRGLLRAVSGRDAINLTLCCRADEWETHRAIYAPLLGSNVQVVHCRGDGLTPLYSEAHAALLTVDRNDYWRFAFPVKLLESIGYGTPVICCDYQTAIAERVRAEHLGWVLESPEQIPDLLLDSRFSEESATIRGQINRAREQHTWAARAETIEHFMLGLQAGVAEA
jgi:glycosyltransferase involved in cell wall biosynthesis